MTPKSASHRMAVLLLPGVFPLEFGTVVQVFGADPHYDVTVCTEHPERAVAGNGFSISVRAGLEALATAHTVVVPGCEDVSKPPSEPVLEAIRRAHSAGARVVSICSAAFVLAAAGLLDGRRATTHWQQADELGRRYPAVLVDEACLYIDDGDILTSAGVTAGIDLCLHLMRADLGASAANERARALVASPHRQGDQRQFIGRLVPAERGETLAPLREWILEHLTEVLDIESLAARAHLSRRTFIRHFHAETGASPAAWVADARLDQARMLLESTDAPVEQIGALSGLGSPSTVRALFARRLGTAPSEYRAMFRGAAGG